MHITQWLTLVGITHIPYPHPQDHGVEVMETGAGDPQMRVRERGGNTPRNHLCLSKGSPGTPAHLDHPLSLQQEEEGVAPAAEEGAPIPPEVGELTPPWLKEATEMTRCSCI